MSIIQKLESRQRVLTVLRYLVDPSALRELATRYHITIPGFRASQAPLNLIGRAVAADCWKNVDLRRGLEATMARIADPVLARTDSAAEQDLLTELRKLEERPPAQARPFLLAALLDQRDTVHREAIKLLDRLESGDIHLSSRDSMRTDRQPHGTAGARPSFAAEAENRLSRTLSERNQQLRALRDECTRQEQKLTRLREQLEAERQAHRTTKQRLKEGGAEDPRVDADGRAAANTSGPTEELRTELLRLREQIDAMRRDYGLLVSGARTLQDVIETMLKDDESTSSTPIKPRKPTRTCDLPASEKAGLPSAHEMWPAHFGGFVERIAASPYVEELQPLDCSGSGSSRMLLMIPDSTLLARFSDGNRSARFLIRTTATTPPTLLWVRRHLADSHFPSV